MALEDLTGNKYINALNSSNPVGGADKVKTLDDHARGIKNVLLKSFPQISGAVAANHHQLSLLEGLDTATLTSDQINTTFTKVSRFEIDSSSNIYNYGAKIVAITTNTTLDSTHNGKILEVNSTTADVLLTLPLNASDSSVTKGFGCTVAQIGSQAAIITGQNSTVTVNAISAVGSYQTKEQWSVLGLYKRATNGWVMYGDAE